MAKPKRDKPEERKNLPVGLVTKVLTESGYRCAVPTCRQILAIDLHHIWEVNAGGPDTPENLIALCPTCHALYHRGTIKSESIYAWKSMLVSLGRAFDQDAIDKLLFLHTIPENLLVMSGDGVLQFSRLVAAGLVVFSIKVNNAWQIVNYQVQLAEKGRALVSAWRAGDRTQLANALGADHATEPFTKEFEEVAWVPHEGKYLLYIPVSEHRRGFRPSIKLYKKTGEDYELDLSAETDVAQAAVNIVSETRMAGRIVIM